MQANSDPAMQGRGATNAPGRAANTGWNERKGKGEEGMRGEKATGYMQLPGVWCRRRTHVLRRRKVSEGLLKSSGAFQSGLTSRTLNGDQPLKTAPLLGCHGRDASALRFPACPIVNPFQALRSASSLSSGSSASASPALVWTPRPLAVDHATNKQRNRRNLSSCRIHY